ncbi:MAG: YscO family type III secretion system apparatus protein [Dongiaceae bacterium]
MFDELLRIKSFREAEAAKEVGRRRTALDLAAARREKADKALDEYRRWSAERERQLYAAIIDQLVQLSDLDRLKLQVLDMREKERLMVEHLAEARKAVEAARGALEQARLGHMAAFKGRQKFTELSSVLIEELRREEARREDVEMEEFTGRRAEADEGGEEQDEDTVLREESGHEQHPD